MQVRIFYRNREGKDTKVLNWSQDLTKQPANQYQAYVDLEMADTSYQSTNSHGIFTKKIVGGALVQRDQADIDKDIGNKIRLIQECEDQIAVYLSGREKVTMLMFAANHIFEYLKSLQAAANIDDSSLSVQGQTSKGTLQAMQTNMSIPIQQLMDDRDAALALLDQED